MPPTPSAADTSFLRAYAGHFVVFEGPDGSGKSTQFRRLTDAITGLDIPLCLVREPGGTPVGERIREVLLDRSNLGGHGMTVRCEALLYMASRAELVERTILPALGAGQMVLADRFVASTLAYQGAAGGVPVADIAALARIATRGLTADLNIIFDIDEASAAKRQRPHQDRMEAKGAEFRRAVRQGYLDTARADPRRYVVVDASQREEEVWRALLGALRSRAESLPPRHAFPKTPPG